MIELNEIRELLSTRASVRAYVNRLNACTCTKGKGVTRKQRRLCGFCQALAGLLKMRWELEGMRDRLKPRRAYIDQDGVMVLMVGRG